MIRNGSHGVILCDWHLITTFASLLFKIHHAIYEQTNSKDHVSGINQLAHGAYDRRRQSQRPERPDLNVQGPTDPLLREIRL